MGVKKLDSEYRSHFKTIPVHRPVTVKAKVQSHPSDSAPEALESSRRAGLLSNQFSSVSEPALQRKRIVPYKFNHNIFPTSTVKELGDKEWLEAVGSDEGASSAPISKIQDKQSKVRREISETEYTSHFVKQPVSKDSPIMLADKTVNKKSASDGNRGRNGVKASTTKRATEHSPERLPPAGRPTYISDPRDKRLLRPSDGPAYVTFPAEQATRNSGTEYSERYYNTVPRSDGNAVDQESRLIDEETYRKVLQHRSDAYGLPLARNTFSLAKKTSKKEKDSDVGRKKPNKDERHRKNSLGSQQTASSLRSDNGTGKNQQRSKSRYDTTEDKMVAKGSLNLDAESVSSVHLAKRSEEKRHSGRSKERVTSNVRNARKAWEEKQTPSISETNSDSARSILGSSGTIEDFLRRGRTLRHKENNEHRERIDGYNRTTRDAGERSRPRKQKGTRRDIGERGRSPTPEMRSVGQSRRHHLDVTTGNSNPLASFEDRYQTDVPARGSEKRQKSRDIYDPSRYSDFGDDASCARSMTSWSDRAFLDSSSLAASARSRSSKRSN